MSEKVIDRKAVKRPDEFLQVGRDFMERLSHHVPTLLLVIGLLLAAALSTAFYFYRSDKRQAQASEALFRVVQKLGPHASEAEKLQQVGALTEVVDQYRGTRAGFDAALMIGKLYLSAANNDQARQWLDRAAAAGPGVLEKQIAIRLIAMSEEASQHWNEAKQDYDRALKLGESALTPEIYLGMARSFRGLNQKDKAKETLDAVKKRFPNTPFAETADSLESQLN